MHKKITMLHNRLIFLPLKFDNSLCGEFLLSSVLEGPLQIITIVECTKLIATLSMKI